MKRTADEKTVSVLLKDFEDADQLLSKVCGHILTFQYHYVDKFIRPTV